MNISPIIKLLVGNEQLTDKQLRALLEIENSKSLNRAAKRLRIATPVLYKYFKKIEAKLKFKLLVSTPRGTSLTLEAKSILEEYKKLLIRVDRKYGPAVGCSPITLPIILNAQVQLEKTGMKIITIVSNDELNLFYLKAGLVDIAIFDDPLWVYEFEGEIEPYEIATDTLIHIVRGKNYIKYNYGAQRIGFQYLEAKGLKYRIVSNTSDWHTLLASGNSFFINESLVLRENLNLKSFTNSNIFSHKIMALKIDKANELDALIENLQRL